MLETPGNNFMIAEAGHPGAVQNESPLYRATRKVFSKYLPQYEAVPTCTLRVGLSIRQEVSYNEEVPSD